MPNFKEHAFTGLFAGVVVYGLHYMHQKELNPMADFDWSQLWLCVGAGLIGGVLPDVLEPATSPNHRGFFHGITFAAVAAYLALGYKWSDIPIELRLVYWACIVGYGSHLYLDALTPKCLPFLGIKPTPIFNII